MTKEELAEKLNGLTAKDFYSKLTVIYKDLVASKLVVIHGWDDCLIKATGAIKDEGDSYGNGYILIDKDGFITSFEKLMDCSESEKEFEKYFTRRQQARKIKAIYEEGGEHVWSYRTGIPHASFAIENDPMTSLVGIIFSLDDMEQI